MKQVFLCTLLCAVCSAQSGDPPVRLAIVLESKVVVPGLSFPVTVELRDAYNLKSQARKAYSVVLELCAEGQKPVQRIVQIAKGKSNVPTNLVIPVEGLWMIKALHPELREDAAYVRARKNVRKSAARGMAREVRDFSGFFVLRAALVLEPEASVVPLDLDLRYTDQGSKYTANGADKCVISAFLSDVAPRDLHLFFHANSGTLKPNPLVIHAGSITADAELTSDAPGSALVEFIRASPANEVTLKSGGSKEVVFLPAIKELILRASPPSITLLDAAQIQFELLDLHGNSVGYPEEKKVYLRLAQGHGELEPNPAPLPANVVQGSASLHPQLTGAVQISATTFGATVRSELRVNVGVPWGTLLILFVLAGITRFLKRLTEGRSLGDSGLDALYHGLRALLLLSLIQVGLIAWSPKIGTHYFATLLAVAIGMGTGYFELSKLELVSKPKA